MLKKPPTHYVRDAAFIIAGILSVGLGLKGFLLSSQFIDGGVTGISMLIASQTGLPLAVGIVVINLPFIWLGYRQIGREFAIKSTLGIAGLSACLVLVPYPDITPDLLLTSLFGGFFIGAGIGLSMRGGAVLDGTEVAALVISRQATTMKVSDVILLLNVVIFGAAAFFLTIELALYSMITYFAASKTIDFIVHGIEEYTAILIVSEEHQTIREQVSAAGWGLTVLKGAQGHGKRGNMPEDVDVLYVVITRLEISRLRSTILTIDPKAFLIQYPVDDVLGGQIKSLPLH
ncbi:YitT family protein [Fibrella forsythiae]|uniref:YitT family protein n=1 Tax=Fibrella forsythiae TaxID=2817061 RepID=A0ABS3JDK1_9BACT|nr:YitT family protein [Fibrella forsythiae]MBO0948080.1 YitT family protein [Fibrella forsythiae]